MEKGKAYQDAAVRMIKALLASYIVTGLLLLVLALLLYKLRLSESAVNVGIIAVYVVSCFLGGFLEGKMMKTRKFLWGSVCGLLYFTILAVISLAGIVYARSVRVGGDKMDEAIMTHVKRKYNMLIGEASAEEIKIKIASAYPMDPEQQIEVKGRDLVTGIPQNIIITSEEVRKAISEQVESIVQAVRIALEQTPPELAADIVDRGIVLTGGGALLKGLDQLLREQTSLPITVVDDPLSTVVMGTGRALDNIHVLKDVCID